jgi:hypothetical protein
MKNQLSTDRVSQMAGIWMLITLRKEKRLLTAQVHLQEKLQAQGRVVTPSSPGTGKASYLTLCSTNQSPLPAQRNYNL